MQTSLDFIAPFLHERLCEYVERLRACCFRCRHSRERGVRHSRKEAFPDASFPRKRESSGLNRHPCQSAGRAGFPLPRCPQAAPFHAIAFTRLRRSPEFEKFAKHSGMRAVKDVSTTRAAGHRGMKNRFRVCLQTAQADPE